MSEEPNNLFQGKKFCPFCLGFAEPTRFIVYLKNYKVSKSVLCPICGSSFRRFTFDDVNAMSTEEFAEWVAEYSSFGFWTRVKPDFEGWKNRLYQTGQAKQFWESYRKVKPKRTDQFEKETEHMTKEQVEKMYQEYYANGRY